MLCTSFCAHSLWKSKINSFKGLYKDQILMYKPPLKDLTYKNQLLSEGLIKRFQTLRKLIRFEQRYEFSDFVDVFANSRECEGDLIDGRIEAEYLRLCADMGFFDIDLPRSVQQLTKMSKYMKGYALSLLNRGIIAFFRCGYEQFLSANAFIVSPREYEKLVNDFTKTIDIINGELVKEPQENIGLKNQFPGDGILLENESDTLKRYSADAEKELALEAFIKSNNLISGDTEEAKPVHINTGKENKNFNKLGNFELTHEILHPNKFFVLNDIYLSNLMIIVVEDFIRGKKLIESFDPKSNWMSIDFSNLNFFDTLDQVCIINKLIRNTYRESQPEVDRIDSLISTYLSRSKDEVVADLEQALNDGWYKTVWHKNQMNSSITIQTLQNPKIESILRASSNSPIANKTIIDERGNLNQFGLAHHLENKRVITQLCSDSQLKKEVERVLKTNKISYKKNVVDYPFVYDFIVTVDNSEIIVNVVSMHHEMIGARSVLIYEEEIKRAYIKKTGKKYLEVNYSDFSASAFPFEEHVIAEINSMITKH